MIFLNALLLTMMANLALAGVTGVDDGRRKRRRSPTLVPVAVAVAVAPVDPNATATATSGPAARATACSLLLGVRVPPAATGGSSSLSGASSSPSSPLSVHDHDEEFILSSSSPSCSSCSASSSSSSRSSSSSSASTSKLRFVAKPCRTGECSGMSVKGNYDRCSECRRPGMGTGRWPPSQYGQWQIARDGGPLWRTYGLAPDYDATLLHFTMALNDDVHLPSNPAVVPPEYVAVEMAPLTNQQLPIAHPWALRCMCQHLGKCNCGHSS